MIFCIIEMLHSNHGSVAQGIEHWFPKPCVAGSNPAGGTTLSIERFVTSLAITRGHGLKS